MKVGLWQIGENGPVKIRESQVNIEKDLEDWIEANPSLIRSDLKIVARQLLVEGGYLDLLALDPQGRWVVVEIKRGELRPHDVPFLFSQNSTVRFGGSRVLLVPAVR